MRGLAAILFSVVLALFIGAGCGRPGERELRAGLRELNRGRDVRALAQFEKALARRPGGMEGAMAWNGVGIACARLGQIERAIQAFEASHRLHPEAGPPAYNLGVLIGRTGTAVEASAMLARAAMNMPDSPLPLEYLGHLYLAQGLNEAALDRLRQARERQPTSPRILTALGVAEWRMQGLDAGMARFMEALEHDAGYAPALYNLFLAYDREPQRAEEARAFGRRFVATAASPARIAAVRLRIEALDDVAGRDDATVHEEAPPEEPPAPVRPSHERLLAEARSRAAAGGPTAGLALRSADEARRAGDEAARVEALRFARETAFDQADVHAAWGTYEFEQDRPREAAAAFRRALALDPGHADTLFGLGLLAAHAGEYDTALVRFRSALESNAALADAQWELARLYDRSLDMSREALREYRVFAQRFPADPRAARALALARQQAERLQAQTSPAAPEPEPEAAPAPAPQPEPAPPPSGPRPPERPADAPPLSWRAAARRDAAGAREAFNRGTAHQERRDFDGAVYYYLRALELDGRFHAALYNLATVNHERGALDEARRAYYDMLDRDSGHAPARYNLAMLYQGRGEPDRALAHLSYLLQRQPEYAPAWYLAGMIHGGRPGGRGEARRHFARFLELTPDHAMAPSVRRWLQAHP